MTIGSYLKYLKTIHTAMGFGMSVPIVFAVFLNSKGIVPILQEQEFHALVDVLTIAAIVSISIAAFYLFHLLTSRIAPSANLFEKLSRFRQAYIVRLALIDSGGLFATVAFMLTESMITLISFTLVLLFFALLRPSKQEISRSLNLDISDEIKLRQDSTVLTQSEHLLFKNRLN